MFTRIADVQSAWAYESEQTLRVLRGLTDAALAQAVAPKERTLGRIAWHLVQSLPEMMGRVGLAVAGPGERAPVPTSAAAIADAYAASATSLAKAVAVGWTDATLLLQDEMYGNKWARGFTFEALIRHQAHHRGQMTVLMRQAGLAVPGVYGPAREEWAGMGMEPPAI